MKYQPVLLSIFIALALTACYNNNGQEDELAGTPLPSFNILLADGQNSMGSMQMANGKPTAILVYRPDCPYSRALVENITKNIEQLKFMQFILVSPYPVSQIKSFAEQYKLNQYENIFTGRDSINFVWNYFGVKGVPFLALYDKQNHLKKTFYGNVNTSTIADAIQ